MSLCVLFLPTELEPKVRERFADVQTITLSSENVLTLEDIKAD